MKINISPLFIILIVLKSFGANATDDWSLRSDSSNLDLANKTIHYQGNAKFENQIYQIIGESIVASQSSDIQKRFLIVNGNPGKLIQKDSPQKKSTLEINAQKIEYQPYQQKLVCSKQVKLLLKDPNTQLEIFSEQLQALESNQKFELKGSPVKLISKSSNGFFLNADAKKLTYDAEKMIIELEGDVQVQTAKEKITAEIIRYHIQTKSIEIPRSSQSRAKMIQKVKS